MTGQDMAGAIQEVERLTRAAHKTEILKADGEPRGVYYLVGPDGKAHRTVAGPDWHGERLATPAQLRTFVADHSAGTEDGKGVLFYDESRIVYVYDEGDRRDRAVCELVQSPQFKLLTALSDAPKNFDQASFVRLLRITLRGCLPPDGNLLPLVRNLKFTSGAETERDVQHGRESVGRQVTAAVRGVDAIPEEVTLLVPVFENHNFKARVACAVEVMTHEQAFRLTPYPLEIKHAMDEAMESVAEVLGSDGLPAAYRGNP